MKSNVPCKRLLDTLLPSRKADHLQFHNFRQNLQNKPWHRTKYTQASGCTDTILSAGRGIDGEQEPRGSPGLQAPDSEIRSNKRRDNDLEFATTEDRSWL